MVNYNTLYSKFYRLKLFVFIFFLPIVCFAQSIAVKERMAEKGYLNYQLEVGSAYFMGNGVNQDYTKALKYYIMAAEQGSAEAQQIVGYMYLYGKGTEVNYQEAFRWYRKSAEQNNMESQYCLGLMYFEGKGVETDKKEAFKWFLLAAEQGHSTAQNNLGYFYHQGVGTNKDIEKALFWYTKAADAGNKDAIYNLALLYLNDEDVPNDYNKSIEYLKKISDQPRAQAYLGICHFYGYGVETNYQIAVDYLKKALGKMTGMAGKIGLCYLKGGPGLKADYAKAAEYFSLGIKEDNCPYSLNGLGVCYQKGLGMEKNPAKAIELFNKAIQVTPKYAAPYANIGICYYEGLGVNKDYKQAVEWFTKSMEVNPEYPSAEGMNYLAKCYRFGRGGLKANMSKADELEKEAAKIDDSFAIMRLGFFKKSTQHTLPK